MIDQDPFHRTLLSQALDYLHSGERDLQVGDTIAVNLTLENRGITVNGRTSLAWQQDLKLIASSDSLDITVDPIVWAYQLLKNETRSLTLWLSAASIGLYALTADVTIDNQGSFGQ